MHLRHPLAPLALLLALNLHADPVAPAPASNSALASAALKAAPNPPPVIDQPDKFAAIVPDGASLEFIIEGTKLGEGPVWVGGDDGHLLFSDVDNNVIHRWSERDGLSDFRRPSGGTNGNAVDPQGRPVHCEMRSRRVTRTEPDGSLTVLADSYNGKKLNSPNDIAIQRDGIIWFSDPAYGISPNQREQPGLYVYRLNPETRELVAVITDLDTPNGVALSPDQKTLYVGDSSRTRMIYAYDIGPDLTLSNRRNFAQIDNGIPDGFTVDTAGNVYSSAPDGLHIFDPQGKRIGKLRINKERTGTKHVGVNLCFGGPDRRTLFLVCRGGVYRVNLKVAGIPGQN